ncbi:TPA: hypothetical protein ACKTGI_003471 [Pseudomonas aeruginosa]
MAIINEPLSYETDDRLKPAVKQLIKSYLNLAKSSETLSLPFSIPNHVNDTAIAAVYISQNLNKPEFDLFNKPKYQEGLIKAVESSSKLMIFGKDNLKHFRDSFNSAEARELLEKDVRAFENNPKFANEPINQIAGFIMNRPENLQLGSISSTAPIVPEYTQENAIFDSDKPKAVEKKLEILERLSERVSYIQTQKSAAEYKSLANEAKQKNEPFKLPVSKQQYDILLKAHEEYVTFMNDNNLIVGNNRNKMLKAGRGFGSSSSNLIGEELRQVVKSENGESHEIVMGHYKSFSNTFTMPQSQENNPIAYKAQVLALKKSGATELFFTSLPANAENYILNMAREGIDAGLTVHFPKGYEHLENKFKIGGISGEKPIAEPVENPVQETVEKLKEKDALKLVVDNTPKPEPKSSKPVETVSEDKIRKLPNDMFIVPGKEGGFVLYGIEGKTKTDRASIKMTLNQIFTDEPNLKINGVFMAKDYAVSIGEAAKGEKNFKEAYDVLQEIKAEVKSGKAPEVSIPKIPEEAKADKPKEPSEIAKQEMEALRKKTGVKPR